MTNPASKEYLAALLETLSYAWINERSGRFDFDEWAHACEALFGRKDPDVTRSPAAMREAIAAYRAGVTLADGDRQADRCPICDRDPCASRPHTDARPCAGCEADNECIQHAVDWTARARAAEIARKLRRHPERCPGCATPVKMFGAWCEACTHRYWPVEGAGRRATGQPRPPGKCHRCAVAGTAGDTCAACGGLIVFVSA